MPRSGTCLGYVQGAVDALELATTVYDVPKVACLPEKAGTDELIRVTLKFIDGHQENPVLRSGGRRLTYDGLLSPTGTPHL